MNFLLSSTKADFNRGLGNVSYIYIRELLEPNIMSKRLTNEEFIEKAKKVHGDKYIYLENTYTKSDVPVKVVCPNHGEFLQVAGDHLRGFGCSACTGKRRLTTEQFIEKANKVHLSIYDYSKTIYVSSNKPVTIVCKKHGDFVIKPTYHLYGTKNGCPKCCYSKGEVAVRCWLEDRGIDFIPQAKFPNCVNPLTGKQLKFDFFIQQYNLCIEVDGIQHQSGKHYLRGRCLDLPDISIRDEAKNRFCLSNGIQLNRLPWLGDKDSLIKQLENIFKQLNKQ
jgi:hypothetical protein